MCSVNPSELWVEEYIYLPKHTWWNSKIKSWDLSKSSRIYLYIFLVAVLMNITDVRVRKIDKEGKMRAVVSVTIDDEFVVHDIKVIEGEKGLFIAMPSRKSADGEYRDIAHPINTATRDRLQTIVLEAYEKAEDVTE